MEGWRVSAGVRSRSDAAATVVSNVACLCVFIQKLGFVLNTLFLLRNLTQEVHIKGQTWSVITKNKSKQFVILVEYAVHAYKSILNL